MMFIDVSGGLLAAITGPGARAVNVVAPFTPSNTARGAGILYPVVHNLPPLYDSKPHDPSSRRIGGYIVLTTFAADCVTSTLFMTACVPNFLARDFIARIAHVTLTYVIFPPGVKRSREMSRRAYDELTAMGGIS